MDDNVKSKPYNDAFVAKIERAFSPSEDANRRLDFSITEHVKLEEALRLLNAAALQSTESIVITEAQLDLPGPKIVFVNPAFTRMTGYEPSEVIGKSPRILQGPATDQTVLQKLRQNLSQEQVFDGEAVMYRKDGTEYVQQWQVAPIRNADGTITHYASVQRDVTELRARERRIARLNQIRALIGGVSSTLIRVHDRGDLFEEVSRVAVAQGTFALAWFGEVDPATQKLKTLAAEGHSPDYEALARESADLLSAVSEIGDRALRTRGPAIVNDFENEPTMLTARRHLQDRRLLSGAAFPMLAFGRIDSVLVLLATDAHFFDEGAVELMNWLAKDLSYALGQIENAHKLQHLAYFDALTELANASLFRDRLSQFVIAAHDSGRKVGVVVFDLENFTAINDEFGRTYGDELLRAVADRLRDSFSGPFALGRIGADSFAVAGPSDNELVASRLCEQIAELMAAPFGLFGRNFDVSAQMGIALFPDDSDDDHNVFKHAELALKLGKSSGQRCTYYSAAMNERVTQHSALKTELRSAVTNAQFILHYQPRLNMRSGEIIGAEALIRWEHPEKGLIEPTEFIALAEETGLIVAIGEWVIDKICSQQAEWIKAGVSVVPVAANVSSVQLEQGDLVASVRNALARYALKPAHLDLELTESAVMHDATAAAAVLSGLKNLGVSLALDDFGTGYSSLAYLKRLPFSRVKIDRTFVTDITHSAEDSAIALAVIAIANRMGLKVVAEGVETQGQFNYLLGHGCDEMQGHYFSPAVTGDVFESFLRTGKRLTQVAIEDDARPTVLVVDDEPGILAALSRELRRDGYRVLTAGSGSVGLELLALHPVQVIISDQRMPEMSGTEFLSIVKDLYPDTMRIILSGYTDLNVVTDSVNRGSVFRFLTKPWNDEALREQVRDAFRRYLPKEGLNQPLGAVTKRE
ncbi:MAG: EAL domain-containing protein [Dokdonella sp.]